MDAGILIHELQLTCESHGLSKVGGDLGKMWQAHYNLPLPLGANAIRKALPTDVAQALSQIYKRSILFGLNERHRTLQAAAQQAVAPLDLTLSDQYIGMYVNHRSLGFDDDLCRAIDLLYQRGADHGLCHFVAARDVTMRTLG